jgi:hypothetical protein
VIAYVLAGDTCGCPPPWSSSSARARALHPPGTAQRAIQSIRPAPPHEDGPAWPAAEPPARPVRERVGFAHARSIVGTLALGMSPRQVGRHPPPVVPAGMRHAELPRVIPHRPCPARSPAFGHPPATSKPYRRRAVHHLRCVSNLGIFSGAALLLNCRTSRIVTGL